jgi:hypothetical protein
MSDSKKTKSAGVTRRDAMKMAAKGIVGVNVGLPLVASLSEVIPDIGPLTRVRRLLSSADPEALAQALKPVANPMINICVVDKTTQALVSRVSSAGAGTGDLNGLAGTGLNHKGVSVAGQAITDATWRGLNLTELFARPLMGMQDGYSLAIFSRFTSNSGGHSLQNANLGMDLGSANYVAEQSKVANGLLGPVGFAMQADANNSRDAFVGPGRVPMATFANVSELLSTVKDSVSAIAAKGTEQYKLRQSLDNLAISNNQSAKTLIAIRDSTEPALAPLRAAAAEGDVVSRQLGAIIALAKAGLCSNFMLTIPFDDTNGGGNLTTNGGSAGLNPYIGHIMLAEIYARLAVELPGAITFLTNDGGRSRTNGDAAAGFNMVSGPSSMIKTGIYGSFPTLAELGDNGAVAASGTDIRLSNGSTTRLLEHKHILSMVLHLLGKDTGIPYPTDPLVKV